MTASAQLRSGRFFRALMADELKRYGRDRSLRVFSFCAAGPFLRGRAFRVLPAARVALAVYRPPIFAADHHQFDDEFLRSRRRSADSTFLAGLGFCLSASPCAHPFSTYGACLRFKFSSSRAFLKSSCGDGWEHRQLPSRAMTDARHRGTGRCAASRSQRDNAPIHAGGFS
jgi:hypothetical protein